MKEVGHIVRAFIFLCCGLLLLYILPLPSLVAEKEQAVLPATTSATTHPGASLFRKYCASCHALDKIIVAPSLRGIGSREPWSDHPDNFKKWVRNPAAFMENDAYTRSLQKTYGVIMPSFPQLTDQELTAIYDYLNSAPQPMFLVVLP